VEVGFVEGTAKGFTCISGEGTLFDFSVSSRALRLLCLRMRKNRARRSEMRTTPPITPPMITSVGFPGGAEELDGSELPDGILLVVMFEDVEDDASC